MAQQPRGRDGTDLALSTRLISFFGSRTFFVLVLLVFIFQASWIAVSARYPQAFDEQFHLGLIKIYAHHLNPFLSAQPTDANQYSAVARDPSYLYHYLMSFPYRLLTHLTHSQTTQIIILRLMNVAMLASGLVLFRKLLRLLKVSPAATHVILAFLVLLPVFTLLGAQINYDNMFIPLSALALYWAAQFILTLRTRGWDWPAAGRLLALCLFTSSVKYPFLALFAGIVVAIFWEWRRLQRRGKVRYFPLRRWQALVLGLLILVSAGLLLQRDGVNTIKYHTPLPECNQVLSVAQCQAYGPWARNYLIAQQHIHLPWNQIATFPFIWPYHMVNELIFTISSQYKPDGTLDYRTGTQLIVMEIITWILVGASMFVLLKRARYLWQDPLLRLVIITSTVYLGALFLQNFRDYTHLGQPLAIHGRYAFPVLPALMGLICIAGVYVIGQVSWTKRHSRGVKAGIASFFLLVALLQGGGFVTYLLRSDPSWFWPQSEPAKRVNTKVKKILKPVILDTQKNE